MKDSYSFDIDDEGLQRSYDRHREAYIKTFDRLGLDYVIVSAMSGAMGGSASEEFLAPCESGEDTFVRSDGGYAANVEAVVTVAPHEIPLEGLPAAHVEDTPDTPTIETLVDLANARFPRADRPWTAADTLKNVVLRLAQPDGTTSALVVGLPGDREVDMKRLEAQVAPAIPAPFEEADFAAYPQLVKGYIGPQVLGEDSAVSRTWWIRVS
jgi:prolyl-tRNA synthetase